MATEPRHITRILKTEALFRANGDEGQSAILTDQNEEWVYYNSGKSKLYYQASQKYWDGAAWTYCDVDFGQVTLHDDLLVDEYIKRAAGGDDRIRFENDKITLEAGGNVVAIFEDDAITFSKVFGAVTGSTIGNLTLGDGSITDSGGTIDFGNENLTTSGNVVLDTGYVDSKAYYYIDGNKFISRDGTNCLLIGVAAGDSNSGNHVVAFGDGAGGGAAGTNTGADNLFLGYLSGNVNTSGQQNAFLGTYTGRTNTTGSFNLFLATNAGLTNLSGSGNVAMGFDALYTNSTGDYNVAVGYQAGRVYLGSNSIFIGYLAGVAATGINNVFIGYSTGRFNVAGTQNTAVGYSSGQNNVAGSYSTFLGYQAGIASLGNFCTMVGRTSGFSTTGNSNTYLGAQTGYYQGTGINNTFIGLSAGQGTGAHNASGGVYLGYYAGFYEQTSNRFFVDNQARTNQATARISSLLYGEFSATVADQIFRVNGKLQIYNGTAGIIDTSYVAPSDLDITCGANKTIELQNTVTEDLQFTIHTGKVPAANFPTWEAFTANTSAYAFSVNDYIDCESNEIPHFWKEATTGHLHVHFSIKTAQVTGANRFAKFTVWLTMSDMNEVFAETSYTAEFTIPTATAALTHLYLDMGDIDLSTYLIGAQIVPRVKRIAATGGVEYADDVYIHQVGIHLEKDTMGSRNELTK